MRRPKRNWRSVFSAVLLESVLVICMKEPGLLTFAAGFENFCSVG